METLSSSEEKRLLSGVKEAVDLVDTEGMSPDDAMTKVARENQWSRGNLRSAVNAFNNGRQVAQWKANDNVLDKLAEFPLACYDTIHDAIWGAKAAEKTASDRIGVSSEYSLPPVWLPDNQRNQLRARAVRDPVLEKAAADGHVPTEAETAHNTQRTMMSAWNENQKALRAFEGCRTKYAAAHDEVHRKIRLLENYFKKSAMDRLPFAVVEDAAATYHGAHGRALFNMLAQSFPREKRAADGFALTPVDRQQAPFTLVAAALRAAKNVFFTKQAMDEAYQALEKTAETLRPFVSAPPTSTSPQSHSLSPCLIEDGSEKVAGTGMSIVGGAAIGSATKAMLDKALSGSEADKDRNKAWSELDDPDHENALRVIRSQAMLNSMMTDPESPIHGYDPDRVISAYNELSQLSPRVAEQPAAMRPLLAKRLAGEMQPFEVGETLNMEKNLKDSKVTTPKTRSIIEDAPDSLLG